MFRNLLIRLFVPLSLTVGVVCFGALFYFDRAINRPLTFGEEHFEIAPGETLNGISLRLVEEGLVPEPWSLRVLSMRSGSQPIIAGEYDLPRQLSLANFLQHIVSGQGQVDMSVTILEGWTFRKMRTLLSTTSGLRQDTLNWSNGKIMEALGHPALHPEGQFFPDTYHYRRGDPDMVIYRKAFQLMQHRLKEVWENRLPDLPLNDPYDILILASIIEKETQYRDEQPIIAGVFYNRLRKGMRLQTDPTVIYGLGESYEGDLTRKHLRADTPYNTYTRHGLTPTPISLPGLDSLKAAVRPAETEAFYFVAKGGGQHHFSRTLKEHNRAVRQYILGKK